MHKNVEVELKWLEELGMIEKLKGPTLWMSPIVAVAKKNNAICISVDI